MVLALAPGGFYVQYVSAKGYAVLPTSYINSHLPLGFDRLCLQEKDNMLLATCSYISKIMPIIILVFVNYDHFSQKMQKLCFFFFKFGKNTSITMQKVK